MKFGVSMFFVIAMMLVILPLMSAQVQTLGTFAANTDINLTQTCATCTYVTLVSIQYPDSSNVIINTNMTKAGSFYYYTFSDTSQYGQYIVTTCGDLIGSFECANYDFYVTSNGQRFNSSQALSLIPLMGLVALLFFIGWSFSKEKWKIKSFFFATSILLCLIIVNSVLIMFGTSPSLQLMGQSGLIIGIAIFSFYMLFLLVYYTKDILDQIKRSKERRRAEKSDPY